MMLRWDNRPMGPSGCQLCGGWGGVNRALQKWRSAAAWLAADRAGRLFALPIGSAGFYEDSTQSRTSLKPLQTLNHTPRHDI